MLKTYNYESLKFFLLTFSISWICWIFAAWVSYQHSLQNLLLPLILGGISGPAIAALIMVFKSKNKELQHDFFARLRPDIIKGKFIPIALLLFPCLIFLAITISLSFGQSADQFSLASQPVDQALEGISILTTIFIIFLVGPFEEIGWRGYGIDSLRSALNLFNTSLIFGAIWGLWHVPAFFIQNGAFQQQILALGLFHTVLYFIDLFFLTIITNWLYIKNNRSILIAILFHSVFDITIGIFHITPITWIIFSLLLLATSIVIVIKDKEIFFNNKMNPDTL